MDISSDSSTPSLSASDTFNNVSYYTDTSNCKPESLSPSCMPDADQCAFDLDIKNNTKSEESLQSMRSNDQDISLLGNNFSTSLKLTKNKNKIYNNYSLEEQANIVYFSDSDDSDMLSELPEEDTYGITKNPQPTADENCDSNKRLLMKSDNCEKSVPLQKVLRRPKNLCECFSLFSLFNLL